MGLSSFSILSMLSFLCCLVDTGFCSFFACIYDMGIRFTLPLFNSCLFYFIYWRFIETLMFSLASTLRWFISLAAFYYFFGLSFRSESVFVLQFGAVWITWSLNTRWPLGAWTTLPSSIDWCLLSSLGGGDVDVSRTEFFELENTFKCYCWYMFLLLADYGMDCILSFILSVLYGVF